MRCRPITNGSYLILLLVELICWVSMHPPSFVGTWRQICNPNRRTKPENISTCGSRCTTSWLWSWNLASRSRPWSVTLQVASRWLWHPQWIGPGWWSLPCSSSPTSSSWSWGARSRCLSMHLWFAPSAISHPSASWSHPPPSIDASTWSHRWVVIPARGRCWWRSWSRSNCGPESTWDEITLQDYSTWRPTWRWYTSMTRSPSSSCPGYIGTPWSPNWMNVWWTTWLVVHRCWIYIYILGVLLIDHELHGLVCEMHSNSEVGSLMTWIFNFVVMLLKAILWDDGNTIVYSLD